MKIKIIFKNGIYYAYNNGKIIGRCLFIPREGSYYNSVEDAWTCNDVDCREWLMISLKSKYKNEEIIFV